MKKAIWIPVSESSLIPGVVSHVKKDDKQKNYFLLKMVHPYSLKTLEIFKGFKTIEEALKHGTFRRSYFKYNKKIKFQKPKVKKSNSSR